MFLLTIGHNYVNFLIQDIFQHPVEMVSLHYHTVLQALDAFPKEINMSARGFFWPNPYFDDNEET